MKIAINCRSFINKKYTGIGRYAYQLLKSLSEIDTENQYLLYIKKGLINLNKRIPSFNVKNFTLKIDRFHHGLEKSIGTVDVYHAPSPEAVTVNNGAKIVVTVHDLIFKTFPEGHTQTSIDETERKMHNIGERADKIICCSENTINDLKKYFKIPDEKITLIYQGVDKNIFYPINAEESKLAERVIKKRGIKDPFILSVGTIEPRKNLENILYSFDKLRARGKFKGKLAVIGMEGWLSEGVEGLIKKLELKEHVVFLGYLTDQELRYFYNKAEAFVFPSFYEGFGFPIIEAFCCGTPVVTSNVSSCPEVAKDSALLVDPYSSEDISEAIARILHDPKLKRSLVEKGFRRGSDFSFRKTAQKTLAVYNEVCQKQ
ncbi:MAG: glycosyltransferase family 4 protein [Candidatus Omnitrophica bacterium]|nr:glycosyltransferase family 4 protein [Candidatus Omnitrophota bacterium]